MMRGDKPLGAFSIRNIGGMDQHAHQEPVGVNPELPFAPVDFFSPIIAAFSACFSC